MNALQAPDASQVSLVDNGESSEIATDSLNFRGLNGEVRVQLFPEGFPSESQPPSSASLLAIANNKGLFAAAAHLRLILGSTASLHEAFMSSSEKKGTVTYNPQLSISLPTPASHVVFTADESHLVLGLSSGGLVVYSVADLISGSSNTTPVFELSINGEPLREVKPNPIASNLVAVVTQSGNVQMMDLDARSFVSSAGGSAVLKTGAGTVAWSQRGKQIVCGMGDGTGWQMTPEGEPKAILPSVPGLGGRFISSILWLENNVFLTVHTPVPSVEENKYSDFHILVRSGSSFQYQKLADPVPPFGMESRTPPYIFHTHIKDYAPSLKDMIIFSNTVSADIGLITRFSTPLKNVDQDVPADSWITATIEDETRRAAMPLGIDYTDSSPIGMALDLSSKENVKHPVASDEIEESPGPLPILMVLNHEGILVAWNVIYSDAIERGLKYDGMVLYNPEAQQQQIRPSQPAPTPQKPASSPFSTLPASTPQKPASSPFGTLPAPTPSTPGRASVFGQASVLGAGGDGSAFGQSPKPGSAFGQPSQLGSSASPFAKSALGGSAFGQPSSLGGGVTTPAFGTPSRLGSVAAAGFGSPSPLGSGKVIGSAFGQASPLGAARTTGGTFGSNSSLPAGASGFGAYANKGGFAAAVSTSTPGSPWGTGKSLNTECTPSAFGMPATGNPAFSPSPSTPFKMNSAFRQTASPTPNNEDKAPTSGGAFSSLGRGMGNALTAPRTNTGLGDANMDDEDSDKQSESDDNDDIIKPVRRTVETPQGTPKAASGAFGGSAKPNPFAAPYKAPNSAPFAASNSPSPFGAFAGTKSVANPFASTSASTSASPFGNAGSFSNSSASPFGAPSLSDAKSPFGTPSGNVSTFGAKIQNALSSKTPPVPPKTPSPPSSPSPPSFTPTNAKIAPRAEQTSRSIDLSPPGSPSAVDDAPLPPDFSTLSKKQDEAEKLPELPSLDEDEEADEDEDSEQDDEGVKPLKQDITTPNTKSKLEPKKPLPPSDGSSIFGSRPSYSDTFGKGGFSSSAPFSSFAKTEVPSSSESSEGSGGEDDDTAKKSSPPGPLSKSGSAGKARIPPMVGGKAGERAKPGMRGGLFNKPPKRLEPERTASAPPPISSGLFGNKVEPKEASLGAFEAVSKSTPSTPLSTPRVILGKAGPSLFSPAVNSRTSASAPTPKPKEVEINAREKEKEPEPESESEESEVDFDRDYSDREDEKNREKLQKGPTKPMLDLPDFPSPKEVQLPGNFDGVFDSIYLSGNMMVNKLGQTSRGLSSYFLGQQTLNPDAKHESAKDMGKGGEWTLGEMEKVMKITNQLLEGVKKDNEHNQYLNAQRQVISRGFIQLDTKCSEIERLASVHSNPSVAAAARARSLTPEQTLQQRNLRREYMKVDKELREAEKAITELKAQLISKQHRDMQGKLVPPTVAALHSTIMKLTGMVQRKSSDLNYLEEKLHKLQIRSRSASATPARGASRGFTPDRSRMASPQRFATPERSFGNSSYGLFTPTPVLSVTDPLDIMEAKEEMGVRKAVRDKLRVALQKNGPRLTGA